LSVLLDTHIWLWWLTGAPALKPRERSALDALASHTLPCIAAISLWEAKLLVARGRIRLDEPFAPWLAKLCAPDVVRILALDLAVVVHLHQLPARFHGDPADRMIVATAQAHALLLATHDASIRRSRAVALWKFR